MSSVPRISGKDAVRAFVKVGFCLDRISGSHHILKNEGLRINTVLSAIILQSPIRDRQ